MKSSPAFTMIELVFVIVVIGILASIAIPRFAATRDDAEISKAIATVGAIRTSLATERQLRTLRGDFTAITSLSNNAATGVVFQDFSYGSDGNATKRSVLESSVLGCANASSKACWVDSGEGTYTYRMPTSGTVVFTLSNGQFNCPATDANCQLLTR